MALWEFANPKRIHFLKRLDECNEKQSFSMFSYNPTQRLKNL